MRFAGFKSSRFVKSRIQAALYYARKKRRALTSPGGGSEPTFIATAGAIESGGEVAVGYLPGYIGTIVANPDDRLGGFVYFPSASIYGGQAVLLVTITQAEGSTGASITIFINDVEIATLTATGTSANGIDAWSAVMLPGSPFPTVPEIEAGDIIKAVLSEQF